MKGKKAKKTTGQPKAKVINSPDKDVKKENSIVSVYGWGVCLEWVPISERNFRRLTVNGAKWEDVMAHFSKSEKIGGALNGRCGVFVGDCCVRNIRLGLKGAEVIRIGGNAKYLLVEESWEKGNFISAEIEGKFDRNNVELCVYRYALKDGSFYNLVGFGYDADEEPDWSAFDTSQKETNHFVVTRDGKRHPVIFDDD